MYWPILYSSWFKTQKIYLSWGTVYPHFKADFTNIPIVFLVLQSQVFCMLLVSSFKISHSVLYFRNQHLEHYLICRTLGYLNWHIKDLLKFQQEVKTFDLWFPPPHPRTQVRASLKLTVVFKLKKHFVVVYWHLLAIWKLVSGRQFNKLGPVLLSNWRKDWFGEDRRRNVGKESWVFLFLHISGWSLGKLCNV